MNKKTDLWGLVLGLVFLISGYAKSLNASAFADIITKYGFANISYVAIPIVIIEIILGLLFIFKIGEKTTALIATILLIIFTLVYSYGLIFKDIEDCGCFGSIKSLNTSPIVLYIRNILLLYFAVDVYLNSSNVWKTTNINIVVIIVIIITASFMSGYTSKNFLNSKTSKFIKYEANKSNLGEYAKFSNDSTYLVFVFSYSCPHCMNSIENLNQYERLGAVDKVIGFALYTDSLSKERFYHNFSPKFEIKEYGKMLMKLTNDLPTTYYVKNDTVEIAFPGELPCAPVFKSILKIN